MLSEDPVDKQNNRRECVDELWFLSCATLTSDGEECWHGRGTHTHAERGSLSSFLLRERVVRKGLALEKFIRQCTAVCIRSILGAGELVPLST